MTSSNAVAGSAAPPLPHILDAVAAGLALALAVVAWALLPVVRDGGAAGGQTFVIWLLVAFGGGSVLFWASFRFRSQPAATAAPPPPTPSGEPPAVP